jgi:NTE family protein
VERKKVALVLSGGAALGFAHIGVIKVLEENNIPIDIVVGTSMGALVGAAYCAGYSTDEMKEFGCKFKTIDFFDVNFNKSGLFSGKGVMKSVNKFLPDDNIENLSKEFACVAVDMKEEKEVVFKTGNVRDAVRASLSIPGIFVPLAIDDKVLIDGGAMNNLPEDVAMDMGADIIISADVLSKNFLKSNPSNAIEVLLAAINVMVKEVQKHKACHADVVIKPDTSMLAPMRFGKTVTLKAIEQGVIETEKYIKDIKKLLK